MYSIVIMYAISASTFFLGKQLILYSSPLFLSGIRTLVAGVLYMVYAGKTQQGTLPIKKLFLPCLNIAVYSFFLSNTLKFWALQHSSTSHAALISVLEPLLVIILAYSMFNERMTLHRWIGLGLCMISSLILSIPHNCMFSLYELFSIPSLFLGIALVASAYGAMVMRRLIGYEKASGPLVLGMSMTIAGVLALLATSLETYSCSVNANSSMSFIAHLSVMIGVSNIIAYSLYGQIIKRYSALLISCGSFARPIFTALYEWLFFNHAISSEIMVAIGFLFLGLALLYKEERAAKISLPIV